MSHTVTFAGSGDAFGSGGRFQTCILVEGPTKHVAIDFGASSLIALQRLGIAHNSLDAVVLTHLHGDHCGGVPFLLLDAMLGARREAPLAIAGPRGTQQRMAEVCEALFPGMNGMTPRFPLRYVEMDVMEETEILDDVCATSFPALHTPGTHPTSVRVQIEGKTVAYSGDGEWNEHLPTLAREADLFVAECYFYAKPVRFHLNYPELAQHLDECRAKRTIFTHLGSEMLAHAGDVPHEIAHDGLRLEI